MTATRLVFVPGPDDAPPPRDDTRIVVLDTAWTPAPADRGDVIPLRLLAGNALRAEDLFEEALSLLDAWAQEARLIDLVAFGGVTYWYRLREIAWHWLHERLIWERVLAGAAGTSRLVSIAVPGNEPALLEVAAAVGRLHGANVLTLAAGPAGEGNARPDSTERAGARRELGRLSALAHRLVVGDARGRPPSPRTAEPPVGPGRQDAAMAARRMEILAGRLRTLGGDPGPVVVLTNMRLQQRIGDPAAGRSEDPNLAPVIARLRQVGLDPVTIGLGLDQSVDSDWPVIEGDPRLLPQSVLRRFARPEGSQDSAAGLIRERVSSAGSVALPVHGLDLAPAMTAWLAERASTIVGTILRQVPRIDGLLEALRPRALVLTHEGIQTPWLQVCRDRRIPTFAVQHGMIYPTHPGYRHPRDPRLPLPGTTFVTGPSERDVLLRHGGYAPGEVVIVGSPRPEMDRPPDAEPLRRQEREAVRRAMGVADGMRMLVVSTGFLPLQRRFVLATSLERLFGEPIPGLHVVFKQHPGEKDEGPYRDLLIGLARARGFAPPPITIVRDVDLYRLLRAADAHLGLLSTVLTDAVVAGAPNLIAVDQAHTDLLGYVAAGVARPIRDAADLRAAVADPRLPDDAARQTFLAAHFQPGSASERIVSRITAELGGLA